MKKALQLYKFFIYLKGLRWIPIAMFLLCSITYSYSQINYTNDCSSVGGTVQESVFGTSSSSSCNGTSWRANLWSSSPTGWVYDIVGSSNGGQNSIDFDYKVINFSGGGATPSSSFNLIVEYSSDASSWSTVHTVSHTPSTSCVTESFTHTPSVGNAYYRWYGTRSAGDFYVILDDVSVVESIGPTITIDPIAISNLDYCDGNGSSASQPFLVSGTSLTANIDLTAPTNFQISTDNTTFLNTITLVQGGGNVPATTIHARLNTGLAVGAYGPLNVTIASTGASTQNVALSGNVTANPITIDAGDNEQLVIGDPIDLDATVSGCGTVTQTILSQDFEGQTENAVVSTTVGTLYQINDSDCGTAVAGEAWWYESGTTTPLANECDNCTGRYALIDYATCNQDYTLVVGEFTLTASTDVTVLFDYVYDDYLGTDDSFEAFLFDGTTKTTLTGFPKAGADAEEDDYTDIQTLAAGTYSLRFRYIGNNDYGAAVDNIVVTKEGTSCVYSWTGPNSFVSAEEDPQITASADGSEAGIYTLTVTDGGCIKTDDIEISAAGPNIIANPASLNSLDYFNCDNGPSLSQMFTVTGSTLTNNVLVTAPLNFEVSTDNTSFSNSVTLNHSGGTVNATVYARLLASLAINTFSGDVTISSMGATNKTVTLNGEVLADTEGPLAICQDVTIQLDASGNATIVTGGTDLLINNGSTDNCGIQSITADITSFNCSNIGVNEVLMTIQDLSSNTSNCYAYVTVEHLLDASFSYSSNYYCSTGTDPSPTITGNAGGIFSSSPAGLVINSSTGVIDLDASTNDSYVVNYTTSGICPASSEFTINISGPIMVNAGADQTLDLYNTLDLDGTITGCGSASSEIIVLNDFESGPQGWYMSDYLDTTRFVWGQDPFPAAQGNGTNVWYTGPTFPVESGYGGTHLTSPIFDFSEVNNLSINWDIRVLSESTFDGAAFYYSLDGGITWVNFFGQEMICPVNNGINEVYSGLPGSAGYCGNYGPWTGSGPDEWATDIVDGTLTSSDLTPLEMQPSVTFRIYFGIETDYEDSDPSLGFAFDNFAVYGTYVCDFAWSGPNSFTSLLEDPNVTATAGAEHAGEYILTASSLGCSTVDTMEVFLNVIPPNTVTCLDLTNAVNFNDVGTVGEPFNCPMFTPEFTGSDEEMYIFYQPTSNETVDILISNAMFDDADGIHIGIFEWTPGIDANCVGGNAGLNITSADGEINDIVLTGGTTYVIVIAEDYNDASSVCISVNPQCGFVYTDNVVNNCGAMTYTATLNFSNFGSATTVNITDGTTTYNNIALGVNQDFSYLDLASRTITLNGYDALNNLICSEVYLTNSGCNGCETFGPCIPDITNSCMPGDLSSAINEGLTGAGPEMTEGGVTGFGNFNSLRDCNDNFDVDTDFKDIWYQVSNPAGSDDLNLTVTGLQAGEYIAYVLYSDDPGTVNNANIIQGWAPSATASGTFFSNSVTTQNWSGFSAYPNIYIRVMAANPNDDDPCSSLVHPSNFNICASLPLPNDECANAPNITLNNPNSPLSWFVTSNLNAATNPGWTCTWDVGNLGRGTESLKDLWYYVDLVTSDGDPDEYSGPYYMNLYAEGSTGDNIITQVFPNCPSSCSGFVGYPGNVEDILASDTLVFASPDSSKFYNNYDAFGAVASGSPLKLPTLDLYDPVYVRVMPIGVMSSDVTVGAHIRAFNDDFWRYKGCNPLVIGINDFDITNPHRANFKFATPSTDVLSDGSANSAGDLWYHFTPNTWNSGTTPRTYLLASITSSYADVQITELNDGEQIEISVYRSQSIDCENPAGYDYKDNFIYNATIDGNTGATINDVLACLPTDISTGGGEQFAVRIRQTAGVSAAKPVITITPSTVKPPENNICSDIWNGSSPVIGPTGNPHPNGMTLPYNPYLLRSTEPMHTFTFTGSNDCGYNNDCNGVSNDELDEADERSVWFIFEVPDDQCNLSNNIEANTSIPAGPGSTIITSMTFDYDAGATNRSAKMYVYDACGTGTLIDCSGTIDGAGSSWTAYGLEQGNYYLLKVKPYWLYSQHDFDFDIKVNQGDVSPCNDDADNSAQLDVQSCNDYASLDTFSAEGATESSPVSGAPENDVWFTFTAPSGANGGPYSYSTSWVTVFFEAVTAHTIYVDLYETQTNQLVTAQQYNTNGSAGDREWAHFGNLEVGRQYYVRVYHKEGANIDVQYMINVYTGPSNEPGWECGENSDANLTGCSSGCNTLSETWYKIDLPSGAPGNSYWMIEVEGEDQHLDFELRSKYLNGNSSYVPCNNGVDGLEGSCADYDHPCSSTALEAAVTISSTIALDGCDTDANGSNDSGVRRVYFNMNGAVPGAKDYYYIRVFVSDPAQAANTTGVKICNIKFNGPYTTQVLAEGGGTPDDDCDSPECTIENVAVEVDSVCAGIDGTFTVSFDVTDGSGFYDVVATTTNATYGIIAGDVLGSINGDATGLSLTIEGTVDGPTSIAGSIFVNVVDNSKVGCEGIPVEIKILECPNCNANAGLITNNSITPANHSTCFGSDLVSGELSAEVIFSADYSSSLETDPGYDPQTGLDYAYILANSVGNGIVQFATDGNFDFSNVPVGVYTVWLLSYPSAVNDLLGNETNVSNYLNIPKTNISQIIADDNDISSGGNGLGLYCLDIDSASANGSSNTVTIISSPTSSNIEVNCGSYNGGGSITVTSSANVEFSIDGSNYQTSNLFDGISNGTYTIYIKSTLGEECETIVSGIVVDCASCSCPTCPDAPNVSYVSVSTCELLDNTYVTQAEMDAAAVTSGGTESFGTFNGAINYAQSNNIPYIVFDPGYYVTDNTVTNAFSLSTGFDITIDGFYIDGGGSTVEGNGQGLNGFADVNADNVTISNINLLYFGEAVNVEDQQGFTMCNSVIDASDGNSLNGLLVNSNSRNTDVTFIDVEFNNHNNFTKTAAEILANSNNASINTSALFCNSSFSCNSRDFDGGAILVGHLQGGARSPAAAGPEVCFIGGGFYKNFTRASGEGGALYAYDNSTITIEGVEFVENYTNSSLTQGGGAITLADGAITTITNSNFKNNTSYIKGGAISMGSGDLNITNTIFEENGSTIGGAIYASSGFGSANLNINRNYFIANQNRTLNGANSKGGAIYVADDVTSTELNNNSFSSGDGTTTNDNLSGCGPDLYLEEGIEVNVANDMEFVNGGPGQVNWEREEFNRSNSTLVGNGWLESELVNADIEIVGNQLDFRLSTSNSFVEIYKHQGNFMPLYQHVLSNMELYSWAFTFAKIDRRTDLSYVIAADQPDFSIANGYAIVLNQTNLRIQLVSFSNGVDDVGNHTVIIDGPNLSGTSNSGSASVKVVYTSATNTWDLHTILSSSTVINPTLTPDARKINIACDGISAGNSYTANDSRFTSNNLPFIGIAYSAASTSSTRIVKVDNVYYREGDGTGGSGWNGAFVTATSPPASCPSTPSMQADTACDPCRGYVYNYAPDKSINNPDGITTCVPVCLDGDWTHYGVESEKTIYFSIKHSGNDLEGTEVDVYVQSASETYNYKAVNMFAGPTASPNPKFSALMRRGWDVRLAAGKSVDQNMPVSVRFYYPLQERTVIEDKIQVNKTADPELVIKPFYWYKNINENYLHTTVAAQMSAGDYPEFVDDDIVLIPELEAFAEPTADNNPLNSIHYVQFPDITSFSGGSGGGGGQVPPEEILLPVELAIFNGYEDGSRNELYWVTESEINSSHFEVERSNNAIDFEKIDESVTAQGFSNSTNEYNLTDYEPISNAYYRLKSIDFDGSFEYSNLIHIERSTTSSETIKVYPNPFAERISVLLDLNYRGKAEIKITNVIGSMIYQKAQSIEKHHNIFNINLDDLPSGLYLVNVSYGGNFYEQKIVKW